MPRVVGWEDSTVVGISEWSTAGGERVGGCLQGECVSEKQGTCYCMHILKLHYILSQRTSHTNMLTRPHTNSNTAHADTLLLLHFTVFETLHWQPQTHTVSSASIARN